MKLPKPNFSSPPGTGTCFDGYSTDQLKQSIKDALDCAIKNAIDAVAFNGGSVQMEAHVRRAIEVLKEQL